MRKENFMLLIAIDDMPEENIKTIQSISDMIVYKEEEKNLKNTTIPLDKVEILITYGLELDEDMLEQMPSLKWIQVFQTGVEHIPLEAIHKRDISLTNVKGIFGIPMSEYVMSIVLYITRNIPKFVQNQKLHKYDRTELVEEVNGKTIGIFGTGMIGKEIAKK